VNGVPSIALATSAATIATLSITPAPSPLPSAVPLPPGIYEEAALPPLAAKTQYTMTYTYESQCQGLQTTSLGSFTTQ
jgi:hypothetical protein